MTFCTNCGNKLSQGATKCEVCGSILIAVNPEGPKGPEAPISGAQSNPDALKTQLSNPGAGADHSTVTPPPPPIPVAIGMQSGRVLGGRYKLERCIGSGGMGEIYRARRMHIGDTVAVKVLRSDVVENEKSRQRFYREARAAAMLHHPNAVVIHDFGEDDDGTAYIVMELLVGRSLRQLLIDEGSVNALRAYGIIRQACAALDAGHRNGIVHRDIKPDNIVLLDSNDGADHVKILDFGIAKLRDKALDTLSMEQRLTNVGTIIGTPHYMAPEQCQGEEADARSDIYSVGVVLYELLTGVAPFLAKTPTGVAIKHVTEKPRPPHELNPNIPEPVERVVLRALEKDPNTRPQTALELAREFETALADETGTLRLRPSSAQPEVDTLKLPKSGEAEVSRKALETARPPIAAAPPQSYETAVSPSTGQLKQSGDAATDQLRQDKEAATELLKKSADTAEQQIATSGLRTQAMPQTELIGQAEAPKPVEKEKPRPAPATIPQPEKKPASQAKDDTLRTDPIGQPARSPEKRAAVATPAPPRPVKVPTLSKSAAVPATKSKTPLLIGVGAVVIGLIVLAAWLFVSSGSQTETASTATASPAASVEPSPSATSAYPEVAAPEGMVYVLGGMLRVGRDDGEENERPAHVANIKPFFIDRTEVTNEQYQKFVAETGYTAPPSWKDNRFPEGAGTLPVTDVSWEDATAYAKWAGKRLPTEEEWEFAARGSDDRRIYPWGEEWIADAANLKADTNDQRQLAPVGQFPKGASPFGVLDLSGNAWEWTSSDFTAYPGGKITPPAGYSNLKVIRGGSYDSAPKYATATWRVGWPATRNDWPKNAAADYSKTGFRLAQDVSRQ
ncbi:MAG: SUMF1/EgtB/PvdO family nonheme iron enzyme [Blastocatellia bacterium]